jgi:HK97 gp10 family phage protein
VAEKHKRTGETLLGVSKSEVIHEGNRLCVNVGISTENSPQAWHAVFVEYGTPRMKADPGIRTAFSKNKAKITALEKKALAQVGVQTG